MLPLIIFSDEMNAWLRTQPDDISLGKRSDTWEILKNVIQCFDAVEIYFSSFLLDLPCSDFTLFKGMPKVVETNELAAIKPAF